MADNHIKKQYNEQATKNLVKALNDRLTGEKSTARLGDIRDALEQGADPNITLEDGQSFLESFVQMMSKNGEHDMHDVVIYRQLIKAGLTIDKQSPVLQYVVPTENGNLMHLLIEHGANPAAIAKKDRNETGLIIVEGDNTLHVTARNDDADYRDMTEVALQADSTYHHYVTANAINAQNKHGETPLYIAVSKNKPHIIDRFVGLGADYRKTFNPTNNPLGKPHNLMELANSNIRQAKKELGNFEKGFGLDKLSEQQKQEKLHDNTDRYLTSRWSSLIDDVKHSEEVLTKLQEAPHTVVTYLTFAMDDAVENHSNVNLRKLTRELAPHQLDRNQDGKVDPDIQRAMKQYLAKVQDKGDPHKALRGVVGQEVKHTSSPGNIPQTTPEKTPRR